MGSGSWPAVFGKPCPAQPTSGGAQAREAELEDGSLSLCWGQLRDCVPGLMELEREF